MAGQKLIVEMGRFTGKTGLQVHERLKNEVNSIWNRLQQTPKTQLKRSPKLPSSQAVMEKIIVNALDRFLTELPAKDVLEKKVGHTISVEQWNQVVGIDRAFSLEELREICRKRHLPHTGDKKELAWRLLGY